MPWETPLLSNGETQKDSQRSQQMCGPDIGETQERQSEFHRTKSRNLVSRIPQDCREGALLLSTAVASEVGTFHTGIDSPSTGPTFIPWSIKDIAEVELIICGLIWEGIPTDKTSICDFILQKAAKRGTSSVKEYPKNWSATRNWC